jgi:peptidyl-prolyl cis-trans isomerase A (cyclophilin A)
MPVDESARDRIMRMANPTAVATINTNHGPIKVDLYGHQAPKTVKNFVGLATGEIEWTHPGTGAKSNDPLYVIFHRIIPGFMIQGGDPLGQGVGGPGYQFDDEISPELDFTEPYVLAMANAGRDRMTGGGTNGSQFFITVGPTTWLQGKHTIFGKVTDAASQSVVEKLASVPTDGRDKPLEDVVIESITIEEA